MDRGEAIFKQSKAAAHSVVAVTTPGALDVDKM
jgi:hypothetical protein